MWRYVTTTRIHRCSHSFKESDKFNSKDKMRPWLIFLLWMDWAVAFLDSVLLHHFLDLLFYAGTIMMMTTMTRGDDDCWQLYHHTLYTYKRFNITCQIKRVWLVNVIYCIKCNIPLSTAIFWLCVKNWNMNKPRVSDPKI